MRRPGVQMAISDPRLRSRIWGPFGTPPYKHVVLIREEEPGRGDDGEKIMGSHEEIFGGQICPESGRSLRGTDR